MAGKKLSPKQENRIAEMDAALERMMQQMENGDGQAVLSQYLTAMGAFHRYSWNNVALIIWQKPEAHRVAGFNTWKNSFKRIVRKGERAIWIWAPMMFKKEITDKETGEVTEVQRRVGFRPVPVFDVSQTDGDPLPEYRVEVPGGESILERCRALAESLEFTLRIEGQYGAEGSAAFDGRISVDPNQSPGLQAQVAVHELAHQLMHQQARREQRDDVAKGKDAPREVPTRQVMELEAEAVVVAVMGALGYDVSLNGAAYLTCWKGDRDGVKRSFDRIRQAAHTILDGLDGGAVQAKEGE